MSHVHALLTAAVLATLAPAGAEAAAAYKWVDPAGTVHYDDRTVAGLRLTQEYLQQRRVTAAPVGAPPAEFVHDVGQACRELGERLHSYLGATRLWGRDPDGQVYPLSARQSGLLIAQTRRDAGRYCAPDAAQTLYAEH